MISKTGPGGRSRQHCLLLHGKLHQERMAPAAAGTMHRGGTPGSSRKLERLEFSSRQNSSTPNAGLCRYSTNRGKRGKKKLNRKPIYATSMQTVTVPTHSYALLQPGGRPLISLSYCRFSHGPSRSGQKCVNQQYEFSGGGTIPCSVQFKREYNTRFALASRTRFSRVSACSTTLRAACPQLYLAQGPDCCRRAPNIAPAAGERKLHWCSASAETSHENLPTSQGPENQVHGHSPSFPGVVQPAQGMLLDGIGTIQETQTQKAETWWYFHPLVWGEITPSFALFIQFSVALYPGEPFLYFCSVHRLILMCFVPDSSFTNFRFLN